MKNIFFSIFILGATCPVFAQNRLYVNPLSIGATNGTSWTDAFTDLHDAMALAEAGDEIWVAQGVYRPSATNDRTTRFQMLSGVRLYGGFAGTELDLSERDWQSHPAVLEGDIGVVGDSTDNSYNLLYLFRPDSLTVVDGFTFCHALANDPVVATGAVGSSGGALYIMAFDGEAYPVIRNCVFERNTALKHGGAVYINGGGSGSIASVFENCRFRFNRAEEGNGGALYRNGGSWVDRPEDIKDCVFEGNLANRQGGAIFFADSPRSDNFDITQTVFQHNRIIVPLGVAGNNSGSVLFAAFTRLDSATLVSIRRCKVIDSRTIGDLSYQWQSAPFATAPQSFEAGNLIINFDSVYSERNSGTCAGESFGWVRTLINNSTFYKDTVRTYINTLDIVDYDTSKVMNTKFLHSVGGMTSTSSTLYLENVTCAHNRNVGFGMSNLWGNAEIIANNLVAYGNTYSNFNGGVVYKSGVVLIPQTWWLGNWKSTVRLSNSSTYDNIITAGESDYVYYRNNAFFLKDDEYQPFDGFGPSAETAIFDHNIINLPDTFNAPLWIKTGNLWETDPQFVNPDSGDFRLLVCSPAINMGNNIAVTTATDIFDNPRIRFGTVDIGAVEMGDLTFADNGLIVKADCSNSSSGSIDASGIEACPPVEYEWSNGPGNNMPTLFGLSAGAYTMTATDGKGRIIVVAVTVPAAASPTLQADGTPVSCFGAADAMLAVMPLTGQPPFAYLWSPTGTADSVDTNLGPGPASVTVTDALGCTATFSFDIPEPDTLQFTATVQDASGQQSADGSIMVNTVTGGTAPYSYLWSPGGSMDDMLSGLLPGFYTLTVTDERGCEAAWTFEVKFISGAGEADQPAVLFLYPVPAGEGVTLEGEIPGKTPAYLQLYDAVGQLAGELSVPDTSDRFNWQITVESLPAGYYTAYLKDKSGQVIGIGKLVKQ